MRTCQRLVSFVGALALPATVFAQATITGTVRDSSGAVLPGVTVEAASPVLIEKVRTGVTDGAGIFQITELRPGIYSVTFTLQGFGAVRREGVELSGNAATQLNVELRVSTVEETITVTGEAPTVDVQSTTRQQVITDEMINTIPSGRNYTSLGQLIPGVFTTLPDQGGALGDPMASLTIHGSRTTDQRVMQNGVSTMTLQAGGNIGIAVPNPAMAAEVTIDTSAVSAEQAVGGLRINYIPRDGGNTFAGNLFVSFANENTQGNNLTQRLRDKGLTLANSIKSIWDVTPGFGGPIRRDRLWFYATGRYNGSRLYAAGMYFNRNAFNPNAWTYEADRDRPAFNDSDWEDVQIRLTAQATPKNKVAFTWDQQFRCSCPGGPGTQPVTATRSPEAAGFFRSPVQRLLHAEWTSPVTNRLLLEAVALHRTERWGFMHPQSAFRDSFITPQHTELLAQMIPARELSNGLQYRSRVNYNNTWVPNYFFRFAASYVTGSHAVKVGLTDVTGFHDQTDYSYHPPVEYWFLNGVPTRINQFAYPIRYKSDLHGDLGVFAQDRWTIGRLTATYGMRFDMFKSGFPEQTIGPAPLAPNRVATFPKSSNIDWKDITPRLGASYDPTGDGRTAIKVSLNKYLASQTLDNIGRNPNPILRLVSGANSSVFRSWNDANRDVVPQCDLLNLDANGECGAISDRNFGNTSLFGQTFDPDVLTGWGNRGFNWEFAAGVQREILPRVSVDAGYFRRWFGNFRVVDNLAVEASDFSLFSIAAPSVPGLSTPTTIGGVWDVVPARFGQVRNHETLSRKYGKQVEHYNGFDLTMTARLETGALLSGGVSAGKWTRDACEVLAKVPEASNYIELATGLAPGGQPAVRVPLDFCHQESPFLTQLKFMGTYIIPVVDVQVSATFQSVPGPEIRADYQVTNPVAMPGLGRPLAGNQASQTFAAVSPLSTWGERLNEVDLRIGKIFRIGSRRADFNIDIFNLFNSDTVLTENPNLAVFRRPTGIVLARFVKIGGTFAF
jgi:hypothetical protein